MVKKYKLIKLYPGSPEIGFIIESPLYQIYGDTMVPGKPLENGEYSEFWEELRNPLFTTEDGVDIFEGDSCVSVNVIYFTICTYPKWMRTFGNNGLPTKGTLIFSDYETARQWVENNKPKYSDNDLQKFFIKFNSEFKVGRFFDEFRSFINANKET